MTRLFKTLLLTGTVGVGMLSLGVGSARADIVPQIGPSDVTLQGDGNYKWSYDAELNPSQKVVNGDFFTIYDFAGFVPGTNLQPLGWTFNSANTGQTPTTLLPLINQPAGIPDSAGIPNLTWTYTGGGTLLGPQDLGDFSAESTFGLPAVGAFSGEATEQSGFTAGSKVPNSGWIGVPAPTSSVPEPCSMTLLGLGIAPLLGGLRRRNRKP